MSMFLCLHIAALKTAILTEIAVFQYRYLWPCLSAETLSSLLSVERNLKFITWDFGLMRFELGSYIAPYKNRDTLSDRVATVSRSRGAYEWPRDRIYDYFQSKMIESSFTECGMAIINRSHIHPTRSVSESTFISLFGASPTVCSLLWYRLTTIRPESARKIHLLYAL